MADRHLLRRWVNEPERDIGRINIGLEGPRMQNRRWSEGDPRRGQPRLVINEQSMPRGRPTGTLAGNAGRTELRGQIDRLLTRSPGTEDGEEVDDIDDTIGFAVGTGDVGGGVTGPPFGEDIQQVEDIDGTVGIAV